MVKLYRGQKVCADACAHRRTVQLDYLRVISVSPSTTDQQACYVVLLKFEVPVDFLFLAVRQQGHEEVVGLALIFMHKEVSLLEKTGASLVVANS